MPPMRTTLFSPTSTATTWLSKDLPSKSSFLQFQWAIHHGIVITPAPQLGIFFRTYRFFKESSDEEREHAEKFMKYQVLVTTSTSIDSLISTVICPHPPHFVLWCDTDVRMFLCRHQNTRGGRVSLQSIFPPLTEFDHPEKGDALYGELPCMPIWWIMVWSQIIGALEEAACWGRAGKLTKVCCFSGKIGLSFILQLM